MKGLQGPWRQQDSLPRTAASPAAIDQDPAFAPKTGEEITTAKFRANNFKRGRHPGDRQMSDLMMCQAGANRGICQPLPRILRIGPYHCQLGIRRTNVGFR